MGNLLWNRGQAFFLDFDDMVNGPAAQDLWSTLEHHLGYKPTKRTHSMAKSQLRILSAMLRAIDDNVCGTLLLAHTAAPLVLKSCVT